MIYFERIIDFKSGKETIREYTAEEIAEAKKTEQEIRAIQLELAAKEATRQSALAKLIDLGLTEEEIAAL